MTIPGGQDERIEALRGLIERLSAPDLTLGEAQELRARLSDLMGSGDGDARSDGANPVLGGSNRGDGPRLDRWGGEATMRVAI